MLENKKKLDKAFLNFAVYFIFFLIAISFTAQVANGWWDGGWPFRQEINVTSSTNTPKNFQVEIILNSSNVGTGFDWSNECLNNMSRIRFTNEYDNDTLDYWVKSCNSSLENMIIWLEIDNNITSSGYITKMYYGNAGTSLYSDVNETFDYYFNMSGLTIESEGAGQDISGGGDVLESGRVFHGYGNSWKVFTDLGTWAVSNDGSQLLELELRALDCGEIVAIRFDTNNVQESGNSYKWCGSQGYGSAPDVTYSGSGNWETVSSVLNDFTISATHIHLPVEDDGDASADAYFKDIRVRKHIATSPTIAFGSEEVINTTMLSLFPYDDFRTALTTINLSCSFATSNNTELHNVSLYGNWSGSWDIYQTKNTSGRLNLTTFEISLPSVSASYSWNCLVYDDSGDNDVFDTNYTFTIDLQKPMININYPIGNINDVTPRINLTSSEESTLRYNIDLGSNYTLCSNCNRSYDKFLHLSEGTYTIYVYANDTVGNVNSTSRSFTIDLNNNFYDNFNDNSSIVDITSNVYNNGNITYSGSIKKYQGIEIGMVSTSMTFIRNQWGGSSNAGETDIVCPGGDANCWFVTQNGTNISSLDISYGVTTLDSDSSTIGYIMYSKEDVHTRFSPTPHVQNSDNFIAICYLSGQWYFEDNNGCDNPFTPLDTDIIVANMTWGISSVEKNNATSGGLNYILLKSINTTNNISVIENITWTEGVNDANNYVNINLSFDNGTTWHNVTNGAKLTNFTASKNMIIKIIFESDGSIFPSITDINITWSNNIKEIPIVEILNPLNNSKLIGNYVNVTFNVSHTDAILNCSIYINNIFNKTNTCNTTGINNLDYNFTRGNHSIMIQANDKENNSANSTIVYFIIIDDYNTKISKEISFIGNNMFFVTTNVSSINTKNSIYNDFSVSGLNAGSFNPFVNDITPIIGPRYYGFTYYWNYSNSGDFNIFNYSIAGINDYNIQRGFVLGLD